MERLIEIIGEAARHVSEDFRARHPAVRWNAIIATRHIIAHEYGEIQPDKIWRVVFTHLPELEALLAPIIAANPPAGDSSESKGTT